MNFIIQLHSPRCGAKSLRHFLCISHECHSHLLRQLVQFNSMSSRHQAHVPRDRGKLLHRDPRGFQSGNNVQGFFPTANRARSARTHCSPAFMVVPCAHFWALRLSCSLERFIAGNVTTLRFPLASFAIDGFLGFSKTRHTARSGNV